MKGYWTACRHRIVVGKRALSHLRAHPDVIAVLEDAIGRVTIPSGAPFLATQVNMGRIVGESGVLGAPAIKLSDTALFARRIGRKRPSRVLADSECPSTESVSIIAAASCEDVGVYLLVSAWVGTLSEKEPWDPSIRTPEEYEKSLTFWCNNALVWKPDGMGMPFTSTWGRILSGE